VIEIPTPPWYVYDAFRLGAKIPKDAPTSHQERAYTTPIWYTPSDAAATKKAAVVSLQKKASLENVKTINLRLTVDGRVALYGVQFDFNEAEIKPTSEATISSIASVMQANPKLKISVVGHTDSLGPHEMNMRLSKQRADAVVKELRTKHKIPAGRMFAAGAGFLAPLSTNDTEKGRALNRRVELIRMK
jgi:outer membrane protein OmpA-like peptidoglycan-associated protein